MSWFAAITSTLLKFGKSYSGPNAGKFKETGVSAYGVMLRAYVVICVS
jgi:hypothetical protein